MGLDMYLYNKESEVGYWRKANQIHKWFVDNVQGGEDDCSPYPVTRDQLEKLLTAVYYVQKNPSTASEHLPTGAGFFFGSTEYGTWYWEDINQTKHILEQALADKTTDSWTYQSSW